MNAIEISPVGSDVDAGAVSSADVLAAALAQAPPSAGALDGLDRKQLSPAGQLNVVVALVRLARHVHAGLMIALSDLVRGAGNDAWVAESEVCAALAWAPSVAQYRLADAETLTRLFPGTLQLLSEGRISTEQAHMLIELTSGLEDEVAREVEARVLPRMAGQRNAATRQAIRRAIVRADPDAAAKRHRYARARRRVELLTEDDGMATLSFYLPADVAQMAMRTLTDLAQCTKRNEPGDERTLDQRRADLLPVIINAFTSGIHPGTATPAIPARINVVVGIETLLELSHEPGHLTGYGPIDPEQTRDIANNHASRWRFLLTSSDGTLIDASPRTYTPVAALKRIVELKRTTCAFPHCTRTSDRCDLDHNHPFDQGGPTIEANLAPLCRRHRVSRV